MPSKDTRLTRREMLKLAGTAIVGTVVASCGAAPTETPVPPTQTARVVTQVQTQIVEKQVPVTQVVTQVQTQVVEKVITATPVPKPTAGKKQLTFWSMWSTQPLNIQFVNTVVADYVKAHPDTPINVAFWEKAALDSAMQAALTAGEGAPDMAGDTNSLLFAKAGWLLDLAGALPATAFKPGILDGVTLTDPKGLFGYPIGIQLLYLLYNPAIFDKAGVKVPASNQFTQDEFVDVIKKVSAAGYSGFANAVGDRNYPAIYHIWAAMTQMVGIEEQTKYDGGLTSWDTPVARQVLTWMNQLRDAGAWPKSFATMGIDAFHTYFHTQQKAAMIYIGSFYPARAFKAVDQGGQSPDFHFGALLPPLMNGAKFPKQLWSNFDSGFVGIKSTKYPDVVRDFYKFMSQPKYGALWSALTTQPSTLNYDASKDWPADIKDAAQWKWYWEVITKVYGDSPAPIAPNLSSQNAQCAGFVDARTNVLNVGMPQNLISIDDGIKTLNAALCKK
jgi:multiple sugar transport system substrate-binding protein